MVYSQTGIPGSLMGYLIAIPMQLTRLPESPWILLNILSFFAIGLAAIQLTRSIPSLPRFWILCWLLFCPWSLEYSTHMLNTDYLAVGSFVFFAAFWELEPRYRSGLLSRRMAAFLMGAALLWSFQFHLSWFLLLPFIGWAALINRREKDRWSLLGFFAGGSMLLALFLLPLILEFGPSSLFLSFKSNVKSVFSFPKFFVNIPKILLRLLSFSSFELGRFLGIHHRVSTVLKYPWAVPGIVLGGVLGVLQVLFMIRAMILSPRGAGTLKITRKVIWAIFIGLIFLFCFSRKGPSSHTFWILSPWVFRFFFEALDEAIQRFSLSKKFLAGIQWSFLFAMLSFSLMLSLHRYPRVSVVRHREKVLQALDEKDYGLIGCRLDDLANWRGPLSGRSFVSPLCKK